MRALRTIRQKGFTLIECVLTIVIISIGLVAMMLLFDNVTRAAMEGDLNITASFLARERLEIIAFDKVYRGYNYVATASYPVSETVSVGGNNYVRNLNIYEVAKSDLTTSQAGSGFKRIDCVVQWGSDANQRTSLSTMLTRY